MNIIIWVTKCNYYLKVTRCVVDISVASQSHHDLGGRSLEVPPSSSAQWCGSQHCSTTPASHGLDRPSAPLMSSQHILALYLTPGYVLMMSPPRQQLPWWLLCTMHHHYIVIHNANVTIIQPQSYHNTKVWGSVYSLCKLLGTHNHSHIRRLYCGAFRIHFVKFLEHDDSTSHTDYWSVWG